MRRLKAVAVLSGLFSAGFVAAAWLKMGVVQLLHLRGAFGAGFPWRPMVESTPRFALWGGLLGIVFALLIADRARCDRVMNSRALIIAGAVAGTVIAIAFSVLQFVRLTQAERIDWMLMTNRLIALSVLILIGGGIGACIALLARRARHSDWDANEFRNYAKVIIDPTRDNIEANDHMLLNQRLTQNTVLKSVRGIFRGE